MSWRIKRKKRTFLIPAIFSLIILSFFVFLFSMDNGDTYKKNNQKTNSNIVFTDKENVYEKIKQKDIIRYLIIGDSIGQGDGAATEFKWFNQLSKKLETTNGVISFPYKITTPGSTVFNGWFDFQNKDFNRDMDLVFISFGQNDQNIMSENQFGAVYESLIRKVKSKYKNAEIYTIIESSIQAEKMPRIIKELSDYYGTTVIDTRIAFKESSKDYKTLSFDGTHPNNDGYTLYSNYIYNHITKRLSLNPVVNVDVNKRNLYSNSSIYQEAKLTSAFEELKEGAKSSKIRFNGSYLGLSINKNSSGGKFQIYIDGKFIKELSSYNKFPITHKVLIIDELSDTEHILEIRLPDSNKKIDLKGMITE